MSNIIIHEQQILKAEETRVTLRNNLRNQGIVCSDDEPIESLASKVDDIQGYNKLLNNTLSGVLIDDTITEIKYSAFNGNTTITEINFENLNYATGDCFRNCTALNKLFLKNIADLPNSSCRGCTALEIVYAPSIQTIGDYFFDGSTSIKTIYFPNYIGTPKYATITDANTLLKTLDFGQCVAINNGTALSNKAYFKYLILRKKDTITTLDNVSRLSGSSPYIYVPNAQINNYENGTNWSSLASVTFLALEGSRFEDLYWYDNCNSTCTLDGNEIEVLDNETVAIFKHTENIENVYENGVELQDTDLVKDRTLTTTI